MFFAAAFASFRRFFVDDGIPRVTLTLHPRLRALGLKPSAFNLSGWIPPQPITAANNRITAKVMPTNRGKAAKLTV